MLSDPIAFILGVKKIILSYLKYYLGPSSLTVVKIGDIFDKKHLGRNIPKTFNFRKTTDLCLIMKAWGSDKGLSSHNYTTFYSAIFRGKRRLKIRRVFELGIGSNNLDTPSNMGVEGTPGASLRGWRGYFPNATVFGADIDKGILFDEDRIHTYYCDQQDSKSINSMWVKNRELRENFDFIVEDGLHSFRPNICFLESSVNKLKVGGIYVVEDVDEYVIRLWQQTILNFYIQKYPNLIFYIVEIPLGKNPYNNKLIVIERIH